jgi:hypothetical protein
VIRRGFQGRPTAVDYQIERRSRIPLLRLGKRSATTTPPARQYVVVRDDHFSALAAIGIEFNLSAALHDDLFPSGVPNLRRIAHRHDKAISLAVRRIVLISSISDAVDMLPSPVIIPSQHPEPGFIDR